MTDETETFVQWTEPYGSDQKQTLICLMSKADIIAWQMKRPDVSYSDPERAFDDFCVVHWAKPVTPFVAQAMNPNIKFNAERARDFTIDSIWLAAETVKANIDHLWPAVVEKLQAPSDSHAKGAVLMTMDVLAVLAGKIQEVPIEQIQDATIVLDAALAAAQKKTH